MNSAMHLFLIPRRVYMAENPFNKGSRAEGCHKNRETGVAALSCETTPAAVRPAAVRPAAVRPAAVRPAAMRPAAVRPAAIRPAAVRPPCETTL